MFGHSRSSSVRTFKPRKRGCYVPSLTFTDIRSGPPSQTACPVMKIDTTPAFTLPEPLPGQPYIEVSALEAGILQLIHTRFMANSQPGESTMCPSLAFSLRHSTTGKHLVFDMGIRRDMNVHPPAVQKSIKGRVIATPQSVDESLRKGGIDPVDVRTVIVSHLHYDQYVLLLR